MGNKFKSLIGLAPLTILLALALSLLPTLATAEDLPRSISPEIQEKIDNFIKFIVLPVGQIQGLGLSIMQNNGELLYSTGYGMADIQNRVPNTNDTQFGLGSISKGFTALVAVKTLHKHFPEMGESVLDTPVAKLAPKLNLTFIDRYRTEHVTVRDLLSHRVCLGAEFLSTAAEAIPTTEEALYRQRYSNESCAFRTSAIYSNQMITAAGEVAAAVANKTFDELAQEIFDELGMNKTAFAKRTDWSDPSAISGRATPYYAHNLRRHPYHTEMLKRILPLNPSGGMFSTPNDMMKYLSFMLNRGAVNGRQIVPSEVIDWITKPAVTWSLWGNARYKQAETDKPFIETDYGLGWGLGSYDGWQYIEHGGVYVPYSSQASVFPGKNLIIYSGIHEAPIKFIILLLHLFIFETLRGNPDAEKVALKALDKFQMGSEEERSRAAFLDYSMNPFGMMGEQGLSSDLKENDEILKRFESSWEKFQRKRDFELLPGIYGSGTRGDLQISEEFNEELNATEFHMQWGKWYGGVLKEDSRFPGLLYQVELNEYVQQDFYANT